MALTGALGAAYLYFRVCVLQQTLAGESIAAKDAEPKVRARETRGLSTQHRYSTAQERYRVRRRP